MGPHAKQMSWRVNNFASKYRQLYMDQGKEEAVAPGICLDEWGYWFGDWYDPVSALPRFPPLPPFLPFSSLLLPSCHDSIDSCI